MALTDPTTRPAGPIVHPFIAKLDGFVALTEEAKAALKQASLGAHLIGPRIDLLREGDMPEGGILITEGIACRYKHRANGARQITAYLVPGDTCDLEFHPFREMDDAIATVSACRVARISAATLNELVAGHPTVAQALRMTALVDKATLREWLLNIGSRSAMERIAHLFCELFVRLQTVGLTAEDGYVLPMTQSDLADTAGLSSVHVNRSLQSLRRQGVIDLKGKNLTILDWARLKTIAEFKANYLHLGDRAAA